MTAAFLYLIFFAALIRYNRFFRLFRDSVLSNNQLVLLFAGKTLAIPAFFLVYTYWYGGLEKFDSGKFFNDVVVVNNYAYEHPLRFLKLLVGLQDDKPDSFDYKNCLVNTLNWDNGTVKGFMYNDNRILIRLHAILHFVAFGSWFVHALFSCFLSFAGIYFIYRSFREFFKGRELLLIAIPCFFPGLWFYTGGFLKEGLTVFVLGCTIYELRRIVYAGVSTRSLWLLALLLLSLLLKPYLLAFSAACFACFFMITRLNPRLKPLVFLGAMAIIVTGTNMLSLRLKGKSLLEAALHHQRVFTGMAQGGIFLIDGDVYLRLPYDSSMVRKVTDSVYTIRSAASYTFWHDAHHSDTMYCHSNSDTLTHYKLDYMTPAAGSNLRPAERREGVSVKIFRSLQHALFTPFFNARSAVEWLVLFENLLLALCFLITLTGVLRGRRQLFLPAVFIFFALSESLLVGFSTPNLGSIFRYRAPAVIFILLAALYFWRTHTAARHNS